MSSVSPHRVLVVEDRSQDLKAICEWLDGFGLKTVGFLDPHKALAYLKRDNVDVMILDLAFGSRIDGFEFARIAVEEYGFDVEKIFFITVWWDRLETPEMFNQCTIIRKPVNSEKLMKLLKAVSCVMSVENK